MAEKRKNWNGLMSGFKSSDLVFLMDNMKSHHAKSYWTVPVFDTLIFHRIVLT